MWWQFILIHNFIFASFLWKSRRQIHRLPQIEMVFLYVGMRKTTKKFPRERLDLCNNLQFCLPSTFSHMNLWFSCVRWHDLALPNVKQLLMWENLLIMNGSKHGRAFSLNTIIGCNKFSFLKQKKVRCWHHTWWLNSLSHSYLKPKSHKSLKLVECPLR